jgi:hypothetical protein
MLHRLSAEDLYILSMNGYMTNRLVEVVQFPGLHSLPTSPHCIFLMSYARHRICSHIVETLIIYDTELEFSGTAPHYVDCLEGTWEKRNYLLNILFATHVALAEVTRWSFRQDSGLCFAIYFFVGQPIAIFYYGINPSDSFICILFFQEIVSFTKNLCLRISNKFQVFIVGLWRIVITNYIILLNCAVSAVAYYYCFIF